MKNKYLLAVIVVIAVSVLAIGIASAHRYSNRNPMMDKSFGTGSMMNMMGMMNSNSGHNQEDIEWMRQEMREHMNFTDEEFSEMVEHCPMMQRK